MIMIAKEILDGKIQCKRTRGRWNVRDLINNRTEHGNLIAVIILEHFLFLIFKKLKYPWIFINKTNFYNGLTACLQDATTKPLPILFLGG
jgi:hypothetical protein